jgi:DNA-binding response OmpR family regulator
MSFKALLFTEEERVTRDLTTAATGLPVDWFFSACPDQAAALLADGEFDLIVIDCDSEHGAKLLTQAKDLRSNRIFVLFCICTIAPEVSAGIMVQKPIDPMALAARLRQALPLFT